MVVRCDRLVNKNKDAYHIVRVFGNYYVVSTRFFQENLSKSCDDKDIIHVKTQFYYDAVKGIKEPKAYVPKNTKLSLLIDETRQLMYVRESLDLGIGMPLNYKKKIKINLTTEKQLRTQVKENIKQIKRQVNASED